MNPFEPLFFPQGEKGGSKNLQTSSYREKSASAWCPYFPHFFSPFPHFRCAATAAMSTAPAGYFFPFFMCAAAFAINSSSACLYELSAVVAEAIAASM